MAATQTSNPLHRLTPEQIEEIGEEFQKIHDEVFADLGDRDATYIRSIIDFHRRLGAISRIFLMASRYPPALVLGTAGLSTAKILENMEIGHNVLHGQWDWRNDPKQKWYPFYLLQPFYNVLLMAFFEWGVAVHDLDFEAIRTGKKSKKQLRDELKAIGTKARRQIVKDYIAFPLLSGRKGFKRTLWANFTANIVRNL